MKHLLNDMSSEEKNSILEQHTGGKQIDTSRFRSLLESTLGNAKPLVNEEEEDDDVVVNVNDIEQEDMKCFSDVSAEDALKVGLNHGGKYKVKKKGCMTKTRYKGPKQKYSGRSFPGMG
jgi:hypothetical protein